MAFVNIELSSFEGAALVSKRTKEAETVSGDASLW